MIFASLLRTVAVIVVLATWSGCATTVVAEPKRFGECGPTGDEQKIIAACEKLIRGRQYSGSDLAAIQAYLGNAFLDTEQYAEALPALDAAIRLDANVGSYFYWRALVHANRDNSDAAADADISKAIWLEPENSIYHVTKGRFHLSRSQHTEAIAALSEGIRLRPGNDDYHFFRGQAYSGAREYKRAVADYSISLGVNPKFAKCVMMRALAHILDGNSAAGEADLDELVRLSPVNRIETDWIRYLKEIQEEKDYANYSMPPIEAYRRERGN